MQELQFPQPRIANNWQDWADQLLTSLQTIFQRDTTEVGGIREFAVSLPPDGYLLCDGSTFLVSSYPELAAKLGTNVLPNVTTAYAGSGFKVGIKT